MEFGVSLFIKIVYMNVIFKMNFYLIKSELYNFKYKLNTK
jgi:hypothetical protein